MPNYSNKLIFIILLTFSTISPGQDIEKIEKEKRENLIDRCIGRIFYELPTHKNDFKFLGAKTNLNNVTIKYYTKVKGSEEIHQYWCSFFSNRDLKDARIIE